MSAHPLELTAPPDPPAGDRIRVYVHPGQSFHSMTPTVVTTILGSCVSVCFFEETARIGGITHYVLPRPLTGPLHPEKIGTTAVVQLFDALTRLGANPRRMKAKVFGGASMHAPLAASGRDLGGQNVAVALEVLAQLGVSVVGQDTGGKLGRKLVFHSDDGSAWVKYLEGGR